MRMMLSSQKSRASSVYGARLFEKSIIKTQQTSGILCSLVSSSHWKQQVVKWVITSYLIVFCELGYGNPSGGSVVAGSATIQTSQENPTLLQINQTSDKAIINWQSFSIGGQEETRFQQPSSSSIALNRVIGGDMSRIFGRLTANGQIMLINPAGILFGSTARVDVAGLVATTADIKNEDFLGGNYHFIQAPNLATMVINKGNIKAAEGLVALVAPGVANSGVIEARLGRVLLASGNEFTLDLYGDQLINFALDNKVAQTPVDSQGNSVNDAILNTGDIIADGGKILVTANVAKNVVQNVINMQGIAQANSVLQRKGEIVLLGGNEGNVRVAGRLSASGRYAGGKGGKVKVLGQSVQLVDGAAIDVAGDDGGGEVLIGGNFQGLGPEPNALNTWIAPQVTIDASAMTQGDGGRVVVWSDGLTDFWGLIVSKGGSIGGNGGFVEVSGHQLNYKGRVDLTAANGMTGTLLLDPFNIVLQLVGPTTGGFSNPYTSPADDSIVDIDADLQPALALANVTIQTGAGGAQAGDITVVDPITWSSVSNLTLIALNNINLNAAITALNGGLILNAANLINPTAAVSVANFTLQDGNWTQNTAVLPAFSANSFTVTVDVSRFARFAGGDGSAGNPYQIEDIYGLQGIGSSADLRGSAYVLNNAIDASSTLTWNSGSGFVPIGVDDPNPFSGIFDGNGFGIFDLVINAPALEGVGVFGFLNGATLSDVGIINSVITGGRLVGGLVGSAVNATLMSDLYNERSTITALQDAVGGIVGLLDDFSQMTRSFNTGDISGDQVVGGVVGFVGNGVLLSEVYNSGRVSAGAALGGLVGSVNAQISNANLLDSYNTGAVFGGATGINVGGLVGAVVGTFTLTNGLNSGLVTGGSNTGGLVGRKTGAGILTYINSFWDTATSGQSMAQSSGTPAGATGGCFTGIACANGGTVKLSAQATYPQGVGEWDFGAIWGIIEDISYPYLRTFNPTTPQVVSGTAYSDQGITALAGNIDITIAVGGAIQATTQTGNNGFYYFLMPTNTITAGNPALLFVDNDTTQGNALAASSGNASITDLSIYNSIVRVSSDGTTLSNTHFVTAKGSLTDTDILYSFSGTDLSLANNVSFIVLVDTPYSLNGNITTNNAGIAFNDSLTLDVANPTLTANSGDIFVSGAVSGIQDLFLVTSVGTITLDNAANDFSQVSITSDSDVVLRDSNALVLGASTISGNFTVNTGGPITQSGALSVNGVGMLASFNAGGSAINLTNAANDFTRVAFNNTSDVSVVDVNSIVLGASNIIGTLTADVGGEISQSGPISANVLNTASTGGTILADANTVNTFNAFNNTAGNIQFSNTANPLTLTGITQNSNGDITVTNLGDLVTTGAITATVGDINLLTLGNSDIVINSDIQTSGASPIILDAAGTGIIQLGGNIDSAGGNIQLNSPTTLTNSVTLATGGGNLQLSSLTGPFNLALNAVGGTTNIAGAVTNLGTGIGAAITLLSSGLTTFNSTVSTNSGMTAAGSVNFNGNVTLGDGDTATVLNSNVGMGNISFTAADGATFGSSAANQLSLNGGAVSIASANDNPLVFNAKIDGSQALTLNAGSGNIVFGAPIGSFTPLGSLSVTGINVFSGGSITTIGNQNYFGQITLNSNYFFTTTNGSIVFNDFVNGPVDITLQVPNGNILFGGDVGTLERLGILQINQAINVTELGKLKVTAFSQLSGTGTTDFGAVSDLDATQTIYVNTNYITGLIQGGATTLIGINGMNATIFVFSLTVGGQNGGTLIGTVGGVGGQGAALLSVLLSGSHGIFTVNGFPIGAVAVEAGEAILSPDLLLIAIDSNSAFANSDYATLASDLGEYPAIYLIGQTPELVSDRTTVEIEGSAIEEFMALNICAG